MAEISVVVFKVGDVEFAADISKVEGVVMMGKVTKLPNVPDYVEGVMDLRGEVLPLINMRRKLSMKDFEDLSSAKVMVINVGDRKFGFVIDDVKSVSHFDQNVVEEVPPDLSTPGRNLVAGIIKDKDRMLILIDVDRVLTAQERVEVGSLLESLT